MSNENKQNRRQFLKTTGQAGIAAGLSLTALPALAAHATEHHSEGFAAGAEEIPYNQQPLLYAYAGLEPAIDAMTMEIHYSKHAATYAKNLADAVAAEKVDITKVSLVSLLQSISKYSVKMRNNGGGHYNHEFFWKSMRAPGDSNNPSPQLSAALVKDFGSIDTFKSQFTDAGKNRFGSGWAWLLKNKEGKLVVGSTPNQDNPLMDISDLKGIPLLGLDVWEHAYYLKYQNKRPDYINAWWKIVDWDVVEKRMMNS
ncbi:MAG: superoxide dismutase [Bacteroidetes bacterium]|nr:superoxide dismutase [Bacteroidota bacterium]